MTAPRPLSYWVRTLDTLLQDEFARLAQETGLDRGQWQVLTRLRVGSIADHAMRDGLAPFVLEGDSADDVLDRVVKDGLVEHQANEYRLTDRGRERIDQVEELAVADIRGRATDGLSEEEYDDLLGKLGRLATNLGWGPA